MYEAEFVGMTDIVGGLLITEPLIEKAKTWYPDYLSFFTDLTMSGKSGNRAGLSQMVG